MNIIDKIAEKIIRKLLPGVVASIEQAAIDDTFDALVDRIDARYADMHSDYYSVRDVIAEYDCLYIVHNRMNNSFATFADDPRDRVHMDTRIAQRAIQIGLLQFCESLSDRVDVYLANTRFYLP